jgi:glycosyltransferase involved in cell wall biosynthesis
MTTRRDTPLDPDGSAGVATVNAPERAVRTFRRHHAGVKLAPVVIVIPAFNEEGAIGAVLEAVPRKACGLTVDTIVVDDGSSDGTAQVAREAGVYVAALEQNSGQGAALRLGYRIAREHGAQYIVTLDADGQWDPADVSRILEPILADEADFVLGSRVLGRAETDDVFRHAGVKVFALLVRLLTGVRVTDTSSGVRAFRVEVTATVRQEEPQYQASELLVGAICQGYRIAERPVVMRKRTAGKSKKGHNFLYGLRYGRTLLHTWWRDHREGPIAGPAADAEARPAGFTRVVTRTLVLNWPATLVLTAGATLRGFVIVAYAPFFWFPTTDAYLAAAEVVRPGEAHPWGYSGFLFFADLGLNYRQIVALQHLLVLVLAALLYAFLVRRGVAKVLAGLAIVPLSLSPLLVNIEHHLLPEPLFLFLLTAAILVLVWRDSAPSLRACAGAGFLAAAAGLTQLVGLVMIVPLVVYLICRRAGAIRLATMLLAFAIPLGGYLLWMNATYGLSAFTTWRGKHLYARVAPFAQCDQLGELTAQQRLLCDSRPVEQRPGPEWYLWSGRNAPAHELPDSVLLGFARKVIAHQPLDYLRAVAGGTAHVFYPGQRQRPREPCVAHWGFPDPLPGRCRADRVGSDTWREHPVTVNRTLAHGLSQYGRLDYLIGPAFLACVLVALFALVWRPRAGGSRARLDAALFAAVGLALTIAAVATANFSYRYTVPLYSTLPIAAAIALAHLSAMPRRARERGGAAALPHAGTT